MDRREALKSAVAAIGAVGTAKLVDQPAESKPVAFVLTSQHPITAVSAEFIRACIREVFVGTEWEKVPVIVCPDGADFRLIAWPPEDTSCES